jgi:hypothetical protein
VSLEPENISSNTCNRKVWFSFPAWNCALIPEKSFYAAVRIWWGSYMLKWTLDKYEGVSIISGTGVQNFTQLGGCADFFCPFIWNRVPDLMRFCDGYNEGTASNFVQISEKLQRRPQQ